LLTPSSKLATPPAYLLVSLSSVQKNTANLYLAAIVSSYVDCSHPRTRRDSPPSAFLNRPQLRVSAYVQLASLGYAALVEHLLLAGCRAHSVCTAGWPGSGNRVSAPQHPGFSGSCQ